MNDLVQPVIRSTPMQKGSECVYCNILPQYTKRISHETWLRYLFNVLCYIYFNSEVYSEFVWCTEQIVIAPTQVKQPAG